MPCETLKTPDGGVIICSRGSRKPKRCAFCSRPSSRLCDGRRRVGDVGHTTSCDKPLCDSCTWSPENEKDYCPNCAPDELARRSAGGL